MGDFLAGIMVGFVFGALAIVALAVLIGDKK